MATYAEKIAALQTELAARADGVTRVGLAKPTSNLFRDRAARPAPRINLKHFNHVLEVDPVAGTEATSFRHGLVHDTVASFEVLTGDGRILTCTRDNQHRDLFYGFANSYGTLGYALKVTQRTIPVKPYINIEHQRYTDPSACFGEVATLAAARDTAFLDGVVFAAGELYIVRGTFVATAPYLSDYTFEQIYYRSIRERASDFMSVHDYLWRWDTDWFWCSKNVGAQHPLLRRLYGRARLNSITYQRIMRWNARVGVSRAWDRLRGVHSESVIQDVDIPL